MPIKQIIQIMGQNDKSLRATLIHGHLAQQSGVAVRHEGAVPRLLERPGDALEIPALVGVEEGVSNINVVHHPYTLPT